MKSRLLTFVDALRGAGLSLTPADSLVAMQAAAVVGIERSTLREVLAAALVKDEADRLVFLQIFERYFTPPRRQRSKGDCPQPSEDGEGRGSGGPGSMPRAQPATERPQRHPAQPRPFEPPHRDKRGQAGEESGQQLTRRRALLQAPFQELSPTDTEACDALVAQLAERFHAHLSRRQRPAHRGRLDIRRTLRRSMSTGGVPINPVFRTRPPGKVDLIALCDHSHSVVTASHFLLGLLTPATVHFRRVRLFAFVDWPVEVSVESGRLVPHTPLDLYARSDFGKVLVELCKTYESMFTRNTILLILGDARNNRRPPRTDLLGRLHATVRQVTWLNPEPPTRWNTGDSVMASYQRYCDALLAAETIRELAGALRVAFRSIR